MKAGLKSFLIAAALVCLAVEASAEEEAPLESACKESGLPPAVVGAIVAGALGGGYMYGRKHKIEVDPQPLLVEMRKDFATRQELESVRADMNTELRKVHARIDDIGPTLGEMKGKLDTIAMTQQKILDKFINRTVNL